MGKIKEQQSWYHVHERELDRVVGEVVLYNVGPLVGDMIGGKWDDELESILYKVDESFEEDGAEPTYMEALEFWLVQDWFADALEKEGELVGEVAGLRIWGRTTSGQAISMDYVVQDILKEIVENRKAYA